MFLFNQISKFDLILDYLAYKYYEDILQVGAYSSLKQMQAN